LGWFGRVLNRQRARSIHFLAMWWFLLFILIHVTLVFITGARVNLNMMFAGGTTAPGAGLRFSSRQWRWWP
jgi:methionine sulfoxide reductase catalytic subunit